MEGELNIVATPGAWKGSQIDWKSQGLHVFDADELAEIDEALRFLKSRGDLDFPHINPNVFPLDKTAAFLTGLVDHLRFGCGFVMLRGLPREKYSVDDMARIYFGLGSYLGQPMYQSYQGEILGHVMDVSDLENGARPYHAGGHMGMHTDSCDIIGLMCLNTAQSGGASRIASAVAVHNEFVDKHPQEAKALYNGFTYRRTENDAKAAGAAVSETRVPVFARTGDELSCYIVRGSIIRAEAAGDAVLTDVEQNALKVMEEVAASPEFYLDLNFAEGDIQFLNNRLMLHGRTDYKDYPEVARRRHLLRLWLKVPSWPLLPGAQDFHTDQVRANWGSNRTPRMELPSTYLDDLSAKAS